MTNENYLQLSLAIILVPNCWQTLLQEILNVIQLFQAGRVAHTPEFNSQHSVLGKKAQDQS
jgi:hypothetical protein